MKSFLILLLTVISVHAAKIDIPDTGYQFHYDSIWDPLPDNTKPRTSWAFSDHFLYLGAGLILLDLGSSDGVDIKDLIKAMSGDYEKTEEINPISGLKSFRSTNQKEKKERLICCIVEGKFTLFTFVEGDSANMSARKSTVKAFLTGIKKKK